MRMKTMMAWMLAFAWATGQIGLDRVVWAGEKTATSSPKTVASSQIGVNQDNIHMEQLFEALKASDPETYRTVKAQFDQQQAMESIVRAYQEQKIGVTVAKKQLYPLVSAEVKGSLPLLDQQIAWARKQIAELEEMKEHPERAIEKRIDQLLGVGQDVPKASH